MVTHSPGCAKLVKYLKVLFLDQRDLELCPAFVEKFESENKNSMHQMNELE